MRPIQEQIIMITGATDGLGRAIAAELAGRGATLILHGRSEERGRRAMDEITSEHPGARLSYYRADLGSLSEVSQLADRLEGDFERIDVLVNNAGVYLDTRSVSADGNELAFQVNYLSHVLLTRRLLPLLREAAPSRIVNVASAGQSAIDFDDLPLERSYSGSVSYQRSKLAQVMFTFDLAEELREAGITVTALHPATFMPTKMVTGRFPPSNSIEDGVRATVRLIATPELEGVTGQYFNMQHEARAHRQAYDPEVRRRLRRVTEELIGERPEG